MRLGSGVIRDAKELVTDHIITIVDRDDFKKWTVVAHRAWYKVELSEEGWSCKCPSPAVLCEHVVACGLHWMIKHGVVKTVDEIDDKALMQAVRLLSEDKNESK